MIVEDNQTCCRRQVAEQQRVAMPGTAYLMSFSAGSLLYRESITVARSYAELGDWTAARAAALVDNALQIRTTSAAKRLAREAAQRLATLTPAQLQLLHDSDRRERTALLWLAICQRYRFIHDFAAEVVREKFVRLDIQLSHDDFDIFFNRQAEWHPEVDRIQPSTRTKLRSNLFAMLREADILSAGDLIQPALLSPALIQVIGADNPADLAVFPISDAQLKEWSA
jgi:hypothetical protein